jgi:hypothetical protein
MAVTKKVNRTKNSNTGKEIPAFFSMKMPDWFAELDKKERESVIRKIAEVPKDAHKLSHEELLGLMTSSK